MSTGAGAVTYATMRADRLDVELYDCLDAALKRCVMHRDGRDWTSRVPVYWTARAFMEMLGPSDLACVVAVELGASAQRR